MGILKLDQNKRKIIFADELNSSDFQLLINDQALALVINNYYSNDQLENQLFKIKKSNLIEEYTHEVKEESQITHKYLGVDRIGIPLNSVYNDQTGRKLSEYIKSGSEVRSYIQKIFAPYQSPIDKLQIDLDQNNLFGAQTANFVGHKMSAGVIRLTNPLKFNEQNKPEPAHFDSLPAEFKKFEKQFAANIYLDTPALGGALEIWDHHDLNSMHSLEDNWRQSNAHKLSKINVSKGDLVIFNCRKPHAVERFRGDVRVSAQVFIGYKPGEALQLWN